MKTYLKLILTYSLLAVLLFSISFTVFYCTFAYITLEDNIFLWPFDIRLPFSAITLITTAFILWVMPKPEYHIIDFDFNMDNVRKTIEEAKDLIRKRAGDAINEFNEKITKEAADSKYLKGGISDDPLGEIEQGADTPCKPDPCPSATVHDISPSPEGDKGVGQKSPDFSNEVLEELKYKGEKGTLNDPNWRENVKVVGHPPKKDHGTSFCLNPECGKEFQKKTARQQYCSRECSNIHRNKLRARSPDEKAKPKDFGQGTCKGCGEPFTKKTKKQQYCCVEHARKYSVKHPRQFPPPDPEAIDQRTGRKYADASYNDL